MMSIPTEQNFLTALQDAMVRGQRHAAAFVKPAQDLALLGERRPYHYVRGMADIPAPYFDEDRKEFLIDLEIELIEWARNDLPRLPYGWEYSFAIRPESIPGANSLAIRVTALPVRSTKAA